MFCIGECIIKYLLIISNILISLGGLAIIGCGIAALVSVSQISDILPNGLTYVAIWIIVLGAIIFLISFLACCGALQGSICTLVTYIICMVILISIKIYMAIYMFGYLSDGKNTVQSWLITAFNNTNLRGVFNFMESIFECCGTTGADAYPEDDIPDTCCANPIAGRCAANDSFDGCTELVGSWFVSFGTAIGVIIICIIVVEAICVIFGLHVCNTIRNKKRGHVIQKP